ncbi:hypothetical protein GF362_04645 [Candidatus Dojkabacteria bacterium]|nr:hypothetical protein [Candidatus Dojkabacteria bacterium]
MLQNNFYLERSGIFSLFLKVYTISGIVKKICQYLIINFTTSFMLLPTHFWISTLAASQLDLTGSDLILAYVFGTFIDVDHLFPFLKEYTKEKAQFSDLFDTEKSFHTFVHEPLGVIPTAIFSWLLNSYIPILFWFVHIFTDHIILKSKKRPFYPFSKKFYKYGIFPQGTKIEWIISSLLSFAGIIWLILF